MSDGIQIFNDNGGLQISSEYKNLALKEKKRILGAYDVAWDSRIRGFAEKHPSEPFTHNGAFIAIQPDMLTPSGNPNVCSGFTRSMYSKGTGTAYVFDLPENIIYDRNYGLEIYNNSGEVTFSSELRYMRVIDSSFAQIQKGNGVDIDEVNGFGMLWYFGKEFTMNYGHPNIAVVFLTSYLEEEQDCDGYGCSEYTLMSSVKMSRNYDVTISDFHLFNQPKKHRPPAEINYRGGLSEACSWVVIDVTGL